MAANVSPRQPRPFDGPQLIPMGHHAGKPAIPLHRPVTVIGSRSTARIHLMSSTVSKAHALLVHSAGRTYIRDLASRSRVYVNGDQVRDIELSEGDLIKIGSFTFQFKEGRRRPAIPPKTLPQAELDVTGGPIPLPIDQRVLLIGRRPTVDVPLLEESASTAHAVIFEMDGEHHVRDLGSRTGTFVNGVTVHQHKLNPGDVVRVGETDIRYQLVSEAPQMEIPAGVGAGESAGPYALEAPTEELQHESAAPGIEHDTMGGLDLMGQVVSEATARYVEKPAAAKPARRDEADTQPIPVEEPAESAAAPAAPRIPVSNADIEDLADELLGEVPAPAESLSAAEADADTTARASDANDEAAPALAAETAEHEEPPAQGTRPSTEEQADEFVGSDQDEAELHPRRGWRGALPHDEEQPAAATDDQADDQTLIEPVVEDEAPLPVASEPPSEPASPAHEVSQDVLRFDQSKKTDSYESDEESGGVAVLDQGALDEGARDESAAPESIPFEFEDAPTSRSDEPAAPDVAPVELSLDPNFDFGKVEQPSQPAQDVEVALDFGSANETKTDAPEFNFSELAGPVEAPALDLSGAIEELPPIEPLAPLPLIDTTAAAALPTEPAAKKPRARKGREKKIQEPEAPAAPTVEAPVWQPETPAAEPLPPVEVLDATLPTPESALDLDRATGEAALDESAIADLLGGAGESAAADAMTDSMFDRAIEELGTGGSTGEIVEERPAPAARESRPPVEARTAPQAHEAPQAREAPQAQEASAVQSKDDTDRFESLIDMDLPGIDEAQSILPARSEVPPPLAEAPPVKKPAEQFQIGANQENFLGGIPLPRPKLPPRRPVGAPAAQDPVDDLIREIDTAAEAAARAQADPTSPFVPVPPPVPGRPARRPRPGKKDERVEPATEPTAPRALDESIPPFDPGEPATKSQITLGFDGLAMPPVRHADVFAQMSPPANQSSDEASSAKGDPSALAGAAGDVMTPMHMVEAPASARTGDEAPPRRAGRRPPRSISDSYKAPPDTFLGGTSDTPGASDEDVQGPGGSSARRGVVPAIPGAFAESGTGRQPPVVYSGEQSEAAIAAQLRRQRLRRIPVLFALMFVAIVGCVGGVYGLMPVKSNIEANLTFRNLESRSKRDRDMFQEQQRRLLTADTTRKDARSRLASIDSEIAPGFLDDQLEYLRVVDRAYWPEARRNTLSIATAGTAADAVRIKSLLLTVFDGNKLLLDDAGRAKRSLQSVQDDIVRCERQLQQLKSDKDALRIKGEQAPTPQQMKDLENDVARLLNEWNTALAATKNAEADLARLKRQPAAPVAPGAPQPLDDAELANMQRELNQLTAKADEQREANAKKAEAAKKALDSAMQNFQEQIAAASQQNQGNPELQAYVASAQKLQETTRQLIDDLISRQENQFRQLMDLKERLNEKMEARRSDMWNADKELQQLTERLAILTRQYNAAVGGGLQKEAEDLKSELELTKNLVKARQDLIPGDAFYADAIGQLQLIIDSTKKNIDQDRAKTDQLVEQLQKSFTSSQPASEKLPADQKDLAAQLEQKLSAINAARKGYNAAVDVGVADIDPALKQQMATLTAGIEARRKQLTESKSGQQPEGADGNRAIAQKQSELDNLRKAEQGAEKAYLARNKDLRDAQAAVADAKTSLDKLSEVINQQGIVEQQLGQLNRDLESKQRDAAAAIEPIKPGDNDIIVRAASDRRPIYAGASGLGMLVLFSSLILWTWHAASREVPYMALAASDLNVMGHGGSRIPVSSNGNGSNGNGFVAQKAEGTEEHHEPVVV